MSHLQNTVEIKKIIGEMPYELKAKFIIYLTINGTHTTHSFTILKFSKCIHPDEITDFLLQGNEYKPQPKVFFGEKIGADEKHFKRLIIQFELTFCKK